MNTLLKLWPYMWPDKEPSLKRKIVYSIVLLFFSKCILIFIPYLFKISIYILNQQTQKSFSSSPIILSPFICILAYNIFRVFQNGLNQLRDYLFSLVGQNAVQQLSHKIFFHIHTLSLRFHLEQPIGKLSRVLDRGTKGIESIVRFLILNTIPTVLECCMAACIIWIFYDWSYFFVLLLTIFLYIWFTIIASNWRISIRHDLNSADSEANARAIDSFVNFETVKYFGNEKIEVKRFDESIEKYKTASIRTSISLGWLNFGQGLILYSGMTILMLKSSYDVIQGKQTLGDFIFVNALLMQLTIPLNFIGSIYREVRQGLIDIEEMFNLLKISKEITDKAKVNVLSITNGNLSFKNVNFSYNSEVPILQNISFSVVSGHKIAIVGPSGAGKSTIARLLFRFYDVKSGEITIDGQDIRDVSQESLRRSIGIVPQDTVLFNDTIAYNICYGKLCVKYEKMHFAARMAKIDHFIERLPLKYNTLVGERGLKLSGGERQRIAIARIILKDPPFLILDEATSALDTSTEKKIQESLDILSKTRTTIIIAHRLSTIMDVDEILVLKNGTFIERGTHQNLLSKDGFYRYMWMRQLETKKI